MVAYLSAHDEQEKIKAIFKSGLLMCNVSLFELLHSLITILLAVAVIASSVINLCNGLLVMINAVFCMLKLLLKQCQDLVETQIALLERRSSWTSERYG